MTILALEFSSNRRSVALADGRGMILAEAVDETGGRGTGAFGLVERALAAAKLAREAVAVVAVGLGPGSYTGIRAAIAVAQGWQLGRGVRLLGISSMASLAAQAQTEKIYGRLDLVVDAQRNEYYLAEWDILQTERREITPLRLVTAAELAARQSAGQRCAGPQMDRLLYPTAAAVAALAVGRGDFVCGATLEPVYLRASTFVKAPVSRSAV